MEIYNSGSMSWVILEKEEVDSSRNKLFQLISILLYYCGLLLFLIYQLKSIKVQLQQWKQTHSMQIQIEKRCCQLTGVNEDSVNIDFGTDRT